jgi:uncharacterized protein (TIGR03437 family)
VSAGTATIVVQYGTVESAPVRVPVVAAAPALFTAGAIGTGPAAALNQDSTLNTPSTPEPPGSVIVLYTTGEGQTSPAGVDGQVAAGTGPKPLLPVTVTIGGQPAQVQYAGAAPGLVAGVMQVNAVIPAGTPAGNVPVSIQVGSQTSQPGVTIAVSAR